MEQKINEIEINGAKYVLENTTSQKNVIIENYVVIRSDKAGVHVGELLETKDTLHGKEVTLINTRRIYYWDGAATLSQLAAEGVTKPKNCMFTIEIAQNTIMGVIEIIPCSQNAILNIKGVPEWKK